MRLFRIVGIPAVCSMVLLGCGSEQASSVKVVAGSTTIGAPVDGYGSSAVFYHLSSIAVTAQGNLLVVDQDPFYRGGLLRMITPEGAVSTVTLTDAASGAVIANPNLSFIALDSAGTIYAASGNAIEKITPQGAVTALAGSTTAGSADGDGSKASFGTIQGLAVDAAGNAYVIDGDAGKVRKITPSGVVTTLAGSGARGAADGTGSAASFDFSGTSSTDGITVDSTGNILVVEGENEDIRKITPAGEVTTLARGGSLGIPPIDGAFPPATFSSPYAIAADNSGNIYVADWAYNIRKISSNGVISTLVKDGPGPYGGITVDNKGNLYATTWPFRAEVLKLVLP